MDSRRVYQLTPGSPVDYYPIIAKRFQQTMETVAMSVDQLADPIARGGEMMTQVLLNDGKIFCYGGGLDAAHAQLFSSSLMQNLERERPPLPAFNLGANPAATGGDFGGQVRALVSDRDLLLLIDSSPGDANCALALDAARDIAIPVVVLSGSDNSLLSSRLNAGDIHIQITGNRSQCLELHTMVVLSLCQLIEIGLLGDYNLD